MAVKKAKTPAKPATKSVAAPKAAMKAGAPAAKNGGAKKAPAGPISSLKKMLGMGAAKQEKQAPAKKGAAAAPVKGRKAQPAPVAKKMAAPVKGAPNKAAAPVKGAAGKTMAPVKGAATAKAAAPVKGAVKGTAAKGAAPAAAPLAPAKGAKGAKGPKPLTSLSLRGEKPTHDANGAAVCREVACELMATTAHYCRMHYIKNWKKIKRKEMILKEKKLNHYIEELVSKYPDKYIEAIRQDLASEKDFAKVISDLEIDEGMDDFESVDTESAEGIIDNIKRDFEDEGDVF